MGNDRSSEIYHARRPPPKIELERALRPEEVPDKPPSDQPTARPPRRRAGLVLSILLILALAGGGYMFGAPGVQHRCRRCRHQLPAALHRRHRNRRLPLRFRRRYRLPSIRLQRQRVPVDFGMAHCDLWYQRRNTRKLTWSAQEKASGRIPCLLRQTLRRRRMDG